MYEIVAGDPRLWWAGLALSALAAVPAVLLRPTRRRTPDRVALVLGILRGNTRVRPPPARPAP
ncbi:hypothetical protein DN402_15155 [Streptomyces sp. SW4]|nr:hypothetical protein DN402_15155 [Streptomyces sp. SW4]